MAFISRIIHFIVTINFALIFFDMTIYALTYLVFPEFYYKHSGVYGVFAVLYSVFLILNFLFLIVSLVARSNIRAVRFAAIAFGVDLFFLICSSG